MMARVTATLVGSLGPSAKVRNGSNQGFPRM
jgi:hypothetical protein